MFIMFLSQQACFLVRRVSSGILLQPIVKYILLLFLVAVLLEFYRLGCKYCEEFAPVLDEIALSFEKDPGVLIAKIVRTPLLFSDFVNEIRLVFLPTVSVIWFRMEQKMIYLVKYLKLKDSHLCT